MGRRLLAQIAALLLALSLAAQALPDGKALLLAAQARYLHPPTHDVSSRGRFGMARCNLAGDRALTRCNSVMSGFTRGSEPKAFWHWEKGRWRWLKDADSLTGANPALLDPSHTQAVRPGVLGSARDPRLDALRGECLRRYPGPAAPAMLVQHVEPYGQTEFGITFGYDAHDQENLYAVWEVQRGRWQWIFDFHFFSPTRSLDALHPLFARHRFSAGMCDKLMRGILRATP